MWQYSAADLSSTKAPTGKPLSQVHEQPGIAHLINTNKEF